VVALAVAVAACHRGVAVTAAVAALQEAGDDRT